MPKFKVGDHVEYVNQHDARYMTAGIVSRVVHRAEGFTEYEVNFQNRIAFRFFESQLCLLPSLTTNNDRARSESLPM
jgi:hypothetical protein